MTFTCSFLPISYVQLKTGSIFLLLPRNFAISCSERNNIRSKSSDCGKPRSIANPPEKFHRDSKLGISKLNRIFKRVIPMAWFCSGSTNAELVGNLFQARLIQNERVRNAMLGVDRAYYSPTNPYQDSPQPIGWGATISAPHMHAHACEHLVDYLYPGSRVLDIGSGSGYLTHVFANLVTDQKLSLPDQTDSHVIGIDHIQELVNLASTNIQKSLDGRKLIESGKVKFIKGDGRLGWKEGGPYDAIHVGAAAASLHSALVEQLNSPGRMFIPVESEGGNGQQHIWVVDKASDGTVTKKRVFAVAYVPLTDAPKR